MHPRLSGENDRSTLRVNILVNVVRDVVHAQDEGIDHLHGCVTTAAGAKMVWSQMPA